MDDVPKRKKKPAKRKTIRSKTAKNILTLGVNADRPTRDNPDPEKEKEQGLECKKCACRHFYVDRTVKSKKKIIRYIHCRHCGTRHTTIERLTG